MAEINIAASGKIPGVRRSKKLSTRVDLTPMVDLVDEVLINDLKHYAITDIAEQEKEFIIKLNGSL